MDDQRNSRVSQNIYFPKSVIIVTYLKDIILHELYHCYMKIIFSLATECKRSQLLKQKRKNINKSSINKTAKHTDADETILTMNLMANLR